MRETGALLGGEMSGHLFFADRYFGYDDAVYAGARLIEIIARTRETLEQMLSDLPTTVYTPEIRIDCPDTIKFQLAEKACDRFRDLGYDIVDVDGVRVKFDDGWGLIRASNTQPVLVTRFEATSTDSLEKNRRTVEAELDSIRQELGAG
jgi:phosphomannomutase/phosphoglucomutase